MNNTPETNSRERMQGVRMSTLRDRHFMEVCRRLMADPARRFTSSRQLAREASRQPAPLFYVSFGHALRMVRRYERYGRLPRQSADGARKWTEIIDRVARVRERHGISDTDALARVLAQGAPEFYLCPSTALRLFYRIRHRRRRDGEFMPRV